MLRRLLRSFRRRLVKDALDSRRGRGRRSPSLGSGDSLSPLMESSDLVDLLVDLPEKPLFNLLHIFLRVLCERGKDFGLRRTRILRQISSTCFRTFSATCWWTLCMYISWKVSLGHIGELAPTSLAFSINSWVTFSPTWWICLTFSSFCSSCFLAM